MSLESPRLLCTLIEVIHIMTTHEQLTIPWKVMALTWNDLHASPQYNLELLPGIIPYKTPHLMHTGLLLSSLYILLHILSLPRCHYLKTKFCMSIVFKVQLQHSSLRSPDTPVNQYLLLSQCVFSCVLCEVNLTTYFRKVFFSLHTYNLLREAPVCELSKYLHCVLHRD